MHKYHPDYWRVFAGDRPLTDFINPEVRPVKEKPFSCQLCHKKYSHETGLTKHLVTHPEYRNDPNFKDAEIFTCGVCEKIFTRENYLERHMEMKHDEEHARAYEIYKQKFIKKTPIILDPSQNPAHPQQPPPPLPPPPLPGAAHNMMDHSGLNRVAPDQRPDHMARQYSMDGHQGPPVSMAVTAGSMRSETVSRPPPESPSDSEMDELNAQRHAAMGRGDMQSTPRARSSNEHRPPLHSESFHSDASFDKPSPPTRSLSQRESAPRWSDPNTPRESPRGFTDSTQQQQSQQQPFDMSQRQQGLQSSAKSNSAPPSRGGSEGLPVFPDSFSSHHRGNKDKDSPTNRQRLPMVGSYLHRQMAGIDEHSNRSAVPGFLERTVSAPHEAQQSSYEQFLRDQLLTEARGDKSEGDFSRSSRDDLSRDDHYLRQQVSIDSAREEQRGPGGGDFYSHVRGDDESGYRQQQDEYIDRHRLVKSASTDTGMPLPPRRDDTHASSAQQLDRHFYPPPPPPRSPAHESSRLLDNHDNHRAAAAVHDDRGFHEYSGYGGGLFPPAHGSLPRDRLTGQFPFNLPPTSLPPSGFPHPMGQRPTLGGQFPPMPRSEEEIAQALESLARAAAMRPSFR